MGRTTPASGPAWIVFATLFYGALAAAALGWNAWAGTPWAFVDEAARRAGVAWGRDVAIGVATAAAVVGLSHLATSRTRWGGALARELAQVLGPLRWLDCAVLAALSGFAEEAFFRGALQPRVGWLAASVLFGLVHFVPRRALLPWTGFAVVMGGVFGGLYLWTGNLVAPVVAHAGINLVNLRLLTRRFTP